MVWPSRASAEKFPEGGGQRKIRTKNSTIKLSLFQEMANGKIPKIAKRLKIAVISLHLLYLYHVWKSREGGTAPLPTPMSALYL